MKKIPDSVIKEIAEELEIGMQALYFNKETFKIITIPGEENLSEEELNDMFKDEITELKKNRENYIQIENMDTRDSYKIMEDFVYEIKEEKIKNRFLNALAMPKPFSNFKYELSYHDELTKEWYGFKTKKTIEWVRDELKWRLK